MKLDYLELRTASVMLSGSATLAAPRYGLETTEHGVRVTPPGVIVPWGNILTMREAPERQEEPEPEVPRGPMAQPPALQQVQKKRGRR